MSSCPNYNLPIYNKIIAAYGREAGKEIIDTLHDNTDFEKWYGRHSATIPNFSHHKIYNVSGDYLDLRDFIIDEKESYDKYLEDYMYKYLSNTITKEELESIYNQSSNESLSKRVKKLVAENTSKNVASLINSDYERILAANDEDLTVDELKVKNGEKSKEDYYKYNSNVDTVLTKLETIYDDDKLSYFYNYLQADIGEFEKIVKETNNKCN